MLGSMPPESPQDRTFTFDIDSLDVDELLAVFTAADAALIRTIVDAREKLHEQLGLRYGGGQETIGPLLVAIRALEDVFFLALGGEIVGIRSRRQ